MGEPGGRVAAWFDIFAELGRLPLSAMPTSYLVERMSQDFPVTAASHNWRDDSGRFGWTVQPLDALDPILSFTPDWADGALDDSHALLTWYARTRDLRPWTNGRVPTAMVSRRQRARCDELMMPLAMDEQLSITYRGDGLVYRAFVLARTGRDFTDDDVVVARHIQRGLLALDAQTSLLARLRGEGSAEPHEVAGRTALTGRELTVLQLLVDGCSTRAIARRLACSPRTVEKHLEHTYRKLGVRDRVNAVRAARGLGLHAAPVSSPVATLPV